MKQSQAELISELIEITKGILEQAQLWRNQPLDILECRPALESWSVLECLAHLNLYGDFYLKEIEDRILKAERISKTDLIFKGGWLGNYSANMMMPKNGKLRKMKTFQDKDPSDSEVPNSTLEQFIKQQKRMLELLEMAKSVSLTHVKTSITLSKWIKFRLGDTFRFVIYHNLRHLQQAKKAFEAVA